MSPSRCRVVDLPGPSSPLLSPPWIPSSPRMQAHATTAAAVSSVVVDWIDVKKTAAETTMRKERRRRLDMEKEEQSLTAPELRIVLRQERNRMAQIAAELASLRAQTAASHTHLEVKEEGFIHQQIRDQVRIDQKSSSQDSTATPTRHSSSITTTSTQDKKNVASALSGLQLSFHNEGDVIEEDEDEEECNDDDLVDLAALAGREGELEAGCDH